MCAIVLLHPPGYCCTFVYNGSLLCWIGSGPPELCALNDDCVIRSAFNYPLYESKVWLLSLLLPYNSSHTFSCCFEASELCKAVYACKYQWDDGDCKVSA